MVIGQIGMLSPLKIQPALRATLVGTASKPPMGTQIYD
jgi:hypothetical protein